LIEKFKKNIPLSEFTTIELGGPAKYFFTAKTNQELIEVVKYSKSLGIRFFILGGGSNVIFSDHGFDGVVIKNEIMGIDLIDHHEYTELVADSGELWDQLVEKSVRMELTGVECLSGIPGTAGATPVQNVGAYGQEVSDTITFVEVVDLETYEVKTFRSIECMFSYRNSRFKDKDKSRFFISKVGFRLSKLDEPCLKYEGLNKEIKSKHSNFDLMERELKLRTIRETVLAIRRMKSMVIDKNDPDSRSCGSFFTNPILNVSEFEKLKSDQSPELRSAPVYVNGSEVKIPAAWLIENSGFSRGFSINGAAISSNHTLALVNKGTSSKQLLELSQIIKDSVFKKFGIMLEPEPEIIIA
jgi:UDP-N-acetylmuramate dehydrogenase